MIAASIKSSQDVWKATAIVTGVSIVKSVLLTGALFWWILSQQPNGHIAVDVIWRYVIITAVIVPVLVCPTVVPFVFRTVHQLNLVRAELSAITVTDQTTGLPNRRGFFDLAIPAFQEAREAGRPVAMILCEIDHLGRINERAGRDVADRTLRLFADKMLEGLAGADRVFGRISHETLAVLIVGRNESVVATQAELLRLACQEQAFVVRGARLNLTTSIGFMHQDDAPVTIDHLLKGADAALQDAKRLEGNRVLKVTSGPASPRQSSDIGGI